MSEKSTILIAEDNEDLSALMKNYLVREGYLVWQAFTGDEAVDCAKKHQPDLVILDLMLPGLSGEEVCKIIRIDMSIPIIVASAKDAETDKLELLGLGADDYITKPFSLKELVARVGAQLRRYMRFNSAPRKERHIGDLTISLESMTVKVKGEPLLITAKEFKLLDFLTLNADQIFSKQQLIDRVWGVDEFIDENTVAVTIARLRDKLAAADINNIVTVWGVGYKWQS